MDVVIQGRTVKLLGNLFDRKTKNVSIVKTEPQKKALRQSFVDLPFPRSSPEKQGISSSYICDFINELNDNGNVFPHCVMIIKNGNVISECSYAPYSLDKMHVTHSLCKSITGIAVCMLIDDGLISLDDSIGKYFDEFSSPLNILRPIKTTVRRLLTMSSGVVYNELGVVTDTEWIKSFLESGFRPSGDEFNYNSMNTFMLSALVRQVTGENLEVFLKKRLFEPLGITDWLWEKAPDGNCKGGWGLYMHLEDLAKIGYLIIHKGVWNGVRLLSENIVCQMTSAQISTPEAIGDYDYGFQMWIGRQGTKAENSFLFNGMLGQNIVCFPEKDLIVACFAGNSSMFQQNDFFTIVNRRFGCDFIPNDSLAGDINALKKLRNTEKAFSSIEQPSVKKGIGKLFSLFSGFSKENNIPLIPYEWQALDGKSFTFLPDYTSSVSVFPLMLQAVQNNFSEGLTDLKFGFSDKCLSLTFFEGSCSHIIEAGIGVYKYSTFEMYGETYEIASKVCFTSDEDDRPVMKIDIAFTETANVRKIKIFIDDNRLFFKFKETPGIDFILEGIETTVGDIRSNKIIDMIFSHADTDYLLYKLRSVVEPEFSGTEKLDK